MTTGHEFDPDSVLNPATGKPYGPGPLWAGTEPMDYPDPMCVCGAPWLDGQCSAAGGLPADYTPRENRGWVVVLFGSSDEGCGVQPCPMSALGPYEYVDEAKTVQAQLPEWTKAHVLKISSRP